MSAKHEPTPATGPAACRRALLAASAFVDGEETPRAALTLHSHLADCGDCRAAVREIDAVAAMLDAAPEIELGPEMEEQLLGAVLQRTAALPAPRRRRRHPGHLRLVGLTLAAGILSAAVGKGLSVGWGRLLPGTWQLPMPRTLFERAVEFVAGAARVALEGIVRFIVRAPEILPPAWTPDFVPLGWMLFLSFLISTLALFALMTHLFWRDVLVWLGIHPHHQG